MWECSYWWQKLEINWVDSGSFGGFLWFGSQGRCWRCSGNVWPVVIIESFSSVSLHVSFGCAHFFCSSIFLLHHCFLVFFATVLFHYLGLKGLSVPKLWHIVLSSVFVLSDFHCCFTHLKFTKLIFALICIMTSLTSFMSILFGLEMFCF